MRTIAEVHEIFSHAPDPDEEIELNFILFKLKFGFKCDCPSCDWVREGRRIAGIDSFKVKE
jgi:hypothetical protein